MKLLISSVVLLFAVDQATANSNCATLSTVFDGPKTDRVYAARIASINGENVVMEKQEHKLAPGRHSVLIYHTDKSLVEHAQTRDNYPAQEMIIDVVPGKVYHLGAKFNSTKRFKPEEKWTAVVWDIKDRECQI
ncbi:hypothetical protein [Permianibacter aggregans]|uniref:DUF2846 domain-containing protein n=1 Tax=Permianibacter aggregans TaxID=1510150 RepID=A0A4R6UUE5_9GAMM|nr:hypothetical protein [Permianibacter aggregans]QGX39781.1 hypothetical protein E2H98_08980 [Permianibacter aggregans]TDQ47094.1 hypothetical protein EV696_11122 [Permianibacter aggregans]